MLLFLQDVPVPVPPIIVPVQQTALALWLSFLTPVSIAILGIIQIVVAKWAAKDRKVVKQTLDNTTQAQAQSNETQEKKLTEIHALVNNEHGVSLKLAATALKRVADLTGEAKDAQAARIAEAASDEHERKSNGVEKDPKTNG